MSEDIPYMLILKKSLFYWTNLNSTPLNALR